MKSVQCNATTKRAQFIACLMAVQYASQGVCDVIGIMRINKKAADAMRGITIEVPFSTTGKVTMRAEDNTMVDYAIGWGTTVPQAPFVTGIEAADWGQILELEKEWKKSNGYS